MKLFTAHSLAAAAAALAFAIPAAHANEAKDAAAGKLLVKSDACFTCHAVTGTKIGPSFTDIAKKYASKSEDDAEKAIETEIKGGVKGTMMMAHSSISASDLDKIADWILSLKK